MLTTFIRVGDDYDTLILGADFVKYLELVSKHQGRNYKITNKDMSLDLVIPYSVLLEVGTYEAFVVCFSFLNCQLMKLSENESKNNEVPKDFDVHAYIEKMIKILQDYKCGREYEGMVDMQCQRLIPYGCIRGEQKLKQTYRSKLLQCDPMADPMVDLVPMFQAQYCKLHDQKILRIIIIIISIMYRIMCCQATEKRMNTRLSSSFNYLSLTFSKNNGLLDAFLWNFFLSINTTGYSSNGTR